MDLTHRFTVPTGVEETWAHFQDIASVAECFPGAVVSSVEGDTFEGSCKVKLGPIALVYNGSGTFVEKDETAHKFVVDAKGKDKRGNGTAGALVTCTMEDNGGSTDVQVVTDLAITGKPAQFGRGVMQDVSDKLLGQFVACLEQRLSPGAAAPEAPAPEAAVDTSTPEGDAALAAASAGAGDGVAGSAEAAGAGTGGAHAATPITSAPSVASSAASSFRPAPAQQDDALDLGAAVLPILLKGYWKQGAVGLLVLAVLLKVLRRR